MGKRTILFLIISILPFHFLIANGDSINQDWYGNAIDKLTKQEYNITYSEELGVYQSPNRKNNLRFVYKTNGFTVKPRVTETWATAETDPTIKNEKIKVTDDWQAEFKVLGFGRNNIIENEFDGNEILVEANTAYVKDNNMKVDYINNEKGMRQNFTIYNKPSALKGMLAIAIQIKTNEKVIVGADALIIKDEKTEFMRYNSLKIWDAEGKELRGWFEASKNIVSENLKIIQILVNDNEAVYPILVDPLSTSFSDFVKGDQIDCGFGMSVATAGDVNGDGYGDILVGAPYYDNGQTDEGAAFLYFGSSNGISFFEDWFGESNQDSSNYGNCVSTAGDVNGDGFSDIIIGAPNYDNNGVDKGAVFLYFGSPNGPSLIEDWTSIGSQSEGNFGSSISTAGDVNGDGFSDIVVGASRFSSGFGAVYIFHGSNSGLSASYDWRFLSIWSGSNFGSSVSTAGDVNGDGYSDVIVGANLYNAGGTYKGAAFTYYGSSLGLSSTAYWMVVGNQPSGYLYLGSSVSTAGDINGDGYSDVIVGAKGYVIGSDVLGAAFIYFGNDLGLSVTPNDILYGPRDGADFGTSVSTAGDINGDGYSDVIVGENVFQDSYVYFGSSTGLPATHDWSDNGSPFFLPNSEYGRCVSTAGDINGDGYSDVIVSAPFYDDKGEVFIYNGSPDGLSESSNWITESNNLEAKYGWSVSTAGDVNGDGYSDVIIGAYYYDNGEPGEGVVFAYHGSSIGLSQTYNWIGEGNENFKSFGYSIQTAGDVNGDGYSDIIIGTLDPNNNESAYASVYYGSSIGLSLTENWSKHYNDISYRIKDIGVTTADDINGDGYSDILVRIDRDSLYNDGTSNRNRGKVYLYLGSSSGLSDNENWESKIEDLTTIFSASTAGDINGDGYSDIILSYKKAITSIEYEIAIYRGSSIGLDISPFWSSAIENRNGRESVKLDATTAGDVNGDGFDDIILGVLNDFNGGYAQSYYGSTNGLSADADWQVFGSEFTSFDSHFAHSVSTAGDVNGDGYSDVIVGAYGNDIDQTYEGTVFVYHGSYNGLSTSVNWSAESNSDNSDFGYCVSTAGDINGDGFSDIIIGAPNFTNGQSREGAAYIYYGSKGNYTDSRLRQNNPTNGNILASGNLTASTGEVQIGLRTKSPFGRADGRMVYEFRKNGEPFSSGQTIINSLGSDGATSFVDLNKNPNGKPILEDISGLHNEYSSAYQWRARREFSLVNNPYQRFGPWKYFKAQFPLNSYAFRPRVFIPLNIIAQIKVLLEGPYNEIDNMTTNLNTNIPLDSPYSEDPRTASSIPGNAVDWILVELRDKNDSTKVLESKSAFLLQDKTIRELNGTSPLNFTLPADDYYIVIKHRNHLPIMSAEPVPLTAN
jgi:hypothetical protein